MKNEDGLEFIYHKEAEWLFYQDVKSEKFWCHNDRYWSLFKDKFDLEYEDIQGITKLLVEEARFNVVYHLLCIVKLLFYLYKKYRYERRNRKIEKRNVGFI